jgi:hypothetical protein
MFIMLLLTCALYFQKINITIIQDKNIVSQVENTNNIINDSFICQNLSLKKTVNCVVDYVSGFYKYNLTDDSVNLSFEQLRNRGGDCKDWSEFYVKEFIDYGFKAEMIIFNVDSKTNHAYVNVHDESGYCVVGALNYDCVDFAKG